jgi:hypothetical protein
LHQVVSPFKREFKIEEETMKLVVLLVMAAFMFVAVDAAYGLGGGGSHRDGRTDSLQQVGKDVTDTNDNSGNAQNGSTDGQNSSFTVSLLSVTVPEPLGLLLLGLGVLGLAGIRRRVKQ